jgi:cysteine synthase
LYATRAYVDAVDAYQLPRLIRLAPNLYAACFTLMKMIPARFILQQAAARGDLQPGTVIAETTSGTFGLALAMQALKMKRRLVLVSDPVIDDRLYKRLIDLGAEVERVPADACTGVGGYQAARMRRLREIIASTASVFCPEQYSNPENPQSYSVVSDLFVEALGRVDCVVGTVGSGGSMSGTVGRLRSSFPGCQAVAVDSHRSVLFGQPDGIRQLRGMGMSTMPGNLNHRLFDSVHWCTANVAYRATRELHQAHGLYMGPSSGAAFMVGRWWAQRNPHAITVVMFPDEGHRYQDTVYNDDWLAASGDFDELAPSEPAEVTTPSAPCTGWTRFTWARRSYAEVMSTELVAK